MRMPSPMRQGHQFALVPSATIERSRFDRSHPYKTTFDAGVLVPVFLDWIVPGDTMALNMTAFARLTTPIKPLMDNLYLESFFFFVPYRLIWTNFVKFMGEQEPNTFTVYGIPQTQPAIPTVGSVADYFGLPTAGQVANNIAVSSLPFRAYRLIYNQWFRDENLCGSVGVSMGDGPDGYLGDTPLKRGKRPDYFTTCLPWAQKAAQAVSVPLGVSAPVYVANGTTAIGVGVTQAASGTPKLLNSAGVNNIQATGSAGGTPLLADLQNATAATINTLRQAFQLQKWYERDARGGTRYTEIVFSHFRVRSPDARLQRAEYLGGGMTPVTISPIVQNSGTSITGQATPQGNLAAFGTVTAHNHGFVKSFTEHGLIVGIVNVRADLTYQQGIERQWRALTRAEQYWPSFAHLGEQAVLNEEIFADGSANDALTFGYQERYAEYRYKPGRVTGKFRSTAAGTLEIWHLSEKFTGLPTLGQTFVEDQTSSVLTNRVAVPSEPDFYFDAWFDYKCARPMPTYSVPGMIDHF